MTIAQIAVTAPPTIARIGHERRRFGTSHLRAAEQEDERRGDRHLTACRHNPREQIQRAALVVGDQPQRELVDLRVGADQPEDRGDHHQHAGGDRDRRLPVADAGLVLELGFGDIGGRQC